MSSKKTNATITQNGKIVPGGYVKNGKSYDGNGNLMSGSYQTTVNGKTYISGNGGGVSHTSGSSGIANSSGNSGSDSSSSGGSSSYSNAYNSSHKITASDAPAIANLSDVPQDKIKRGNVYINGDFKTNVPLYGGYFYDESTGKAYTQELYEKGTSKYYEISEENGIPTGYYFYDEPTATTTHGGDGDYHYTEIVRPDKIDFDIPQPSFTSDVKRVTKYTYYFGLDAVLAKKIALSANSCFVSSPILLDDTTEYLMLESDYFCGDNGSAEFYIIDGQNEFPIRPYNELQIHNESLFLNLEPRFAIDTSQPVTVKHFGKICNISYTDIINDINLWEDVSNRYEYTISYTPANGDTYSPLYQKLYIKIILRDYDQSMAAPYIQNVTLRNYTKGGLWQ